VAAGRFRQDLLFRLAVGRVQGAPPARSAPKTSPCSRGTSRACSARRLHPTTWCALQLRAWPGNVRELRNVVERAVMLSGIAAVTVDLDDLDEP
jgi:DNA-binding NtrC family response regulator